nr:hypothetical protein Iba_chr11eCG12090 [Ipomoea batatas]
MEGRYVILRAVILTCTLTNWSNHGDERSSGQAFHLETSGALRTNVGQLNASYGLDVLSGCSKRLVSLISMLTQEISDLGEPFVATMGISNVRPAMLQGVGLAQPSGETSYSPEMEDFLAIANDSPESLVGKYDTYPNRMFSKAPRDTVPSSLPSDHPKVCLVRPESLSDYACEMMEKPLEPIPSSCGLSSTSPTQGPKGPHISRQSQAYSGARSDPPALTHFVVDCPEFSGQPRHMSSCGICDGEASTGTRLGIRSGAGIGNLVGEQGHHGGEVRLLEALDQGCVDLFLDGLAARREGPLPVHPGQFVPDLRVDEGGEELLGYGLVGADEPSKAAGVLHLVDGLFLGLLRHVSSGFRLAEFLLGLLGSILGGCKLPLQLPNSTLGRGDLLLEGHDLFLLNAL